jgi:hypothetical protein
VPSLPPRPPSPHHLLPRAMLMRRGWVQVLEGMPCPHGGTGSCAGVRGDARHPRQPRVPPRRHLGERPQGPPAQAIRSTPLALFSSPSAPLPSLLSPPLTPPFPSLLQSMRLALTPPLLLGCSAAEHAAGPGAQPGAAQAQVLPGQGGHHDRPGPLRLHARGREEGKDGRMDTI